MSNLLIYGLEIDTVANLGVAIGTLAMAFVTAIMAWLTHLSLKSSKEQLEMQKKQFMNQDLEFAKEQAMDQIVFIINPLREELIFEIKKIQSPPVNFHKSNEYQSLEFPHTTSKRFFLTKSNLGELTTREVPLDYIIRDLNKRYPSLGTALEERHRLYLQISSNNADIENELQSESSKELLNELVEKYWFTQTEWMEDEDREYATAYIDEYEDKIVNGKTLQVSTGIYAIPVHTFIDRIIELLYYEIWDIDIRTVDCFDKDIVVYSSDIRRDSLEMKRDSEIWRSKENVPGLLAELLRVDKDLITQIDTIVAEYKERYHLSAGQLIPGI